MVTKFGYRFGLCLIALSGLAACSRSGEGPSGGSTQIAAQVNDKEISIHQVQARIESQPGLTQQLGDKVYDRVLDNLIEQELAAQAARSAGLEQSPKVVQAIELAKREVLARAYQDQLAAKAVFPDEHAISSYFDEHPELFSQRKQYQLQESLLSVPSEQVDALKARVEGLSSVAELNTLVTQSGLTHSVPTGTHWAETLPMDVLPQLASRKVGQSVVIGRSDGLLVLTVLRTELSPRSLAQVRDVIRDALHSQNRKDALRKGMESLRQQAKIRKVSSPASTAS